MEGWSLVAGAVARSLFEVPGTPCWVRVQLVREEGVSYRPRIGGPEDAAALLMELAGR